MLRKRNPLYVYGEEHSPLMSADLNYGCHMLRRFTKYGDSVAIIDAATGENLTYAQLAQLTVDIALSLARIGVRKGHVIAICCEERLEYLPTMLGIICSGATFTHIYPAEKAILQHKTQLVKPKVLFCSLSIYDTHRDALNSAGSEETFVIFGDEPRGDHAILFEHFLTERAPAERFAAASVNGCTDRAIIFFTSGTTGLPKGLPMTHHQVLTRTLASSNKRGNTVLSGNMFHLLYHAFLHDGATFVLTPKVTQKTVLEAIQKYKAKIVFLTPHNIFELMNYEDLDKFDASSLKHIMSGCSPLRASLVKDIKLRFPKVHVSQRYGAVEVGLISSETNLNMAKPESVGTASAGVIIKVIDRVTKVPVGPNQRGEICVKTARICKEYLGDATCSHLDEEGFHRTGDLGYYDEDRYFYIVDRIKDLIKYHGVEVAPSSLEMVMMQHPAVYEAAVVGVMDQDGNDLPTAFVVLRPGVKVAAQELTSYVNAEMGDVTTLAGGVRFIQSLPRGVRCKLDREALRLAVKLEL